MNDLRQLREMSTHDLFQRALSLLSEVPAQPAPATSPAPERRRLLAGWRRRQPNQQSSASDTFTTQAQLRVAYASMLRTDNGSSAGATAETAFRSKVVRTIQAAG
jgi:hypothetical protein